MSRKSRPSASFRDEDRSANVAVVVAGSSEFQLLAPPLVSLNLDLLH